MKGDPSKDALEHFEIRWESDMSIGRTNLFTRAVIALSVVAASLAFGSFGSGTAHAADSFSCTATYEPSAAQYRVTWTGVPSTAWRLVIERNAYGDWYWSGRAAPTATEFLHKEPGSGAIQLFYRIKVLAADRSIIINTDCTVTFPTKFSCGYKFTVLGAGLSGGRATWDPELGANTDGIDYVISAKTGTSDRFWWQKTTDATSTTLAPTHDATVPGIIVAVRYRHKIINFARCSLYPDATTPRIYCTSGKAQFQPWFTATMHFATAEFFDFTADLYRQDTPGGPWALRHTFIGPEFDLRQDPLPPSDPAGLPHVRYRIELWNTTHTTLIDQAICESVVDG